MRNSDAPAKLNCSFVDGRIFKSDSSLLDAKELCHSVKEVQSSIGVALISSYTTDDDGRQSLSDCQGSRKSNEQLVPKWPPLGNG